MTIDKNRAMRHEYRISEKTLWISGLLFGIYGLILGMYVNHHKNQKAVFRYGFWILAITETYIIYRIKIIVKRNLKKIFSNLLLQKLKEAIE